LEEDLSCGAMTILLPVSLATLQVLAKLCFGIGTLLATLLANFSP
jgi:hypothetical protein